MVKSGKSFLTYKGITGILFIKLTHPIPRNARDFPSLAREGRSTEGTKG